MIKRKVTTTTDPYGVIEVRKEQITFDIATVTEDDQPVIAAFMEEDDAALLGGILADVERSIRNYWISAGLPEAPGLWFSVAGGGWTSERPACSMAEAGSIVVCQHPAALADPASELERSWSQWQNLQSARVAVAAGNLHRAARFAFFLGGSQAEAQLARRHGHDARDGRGRKAARKAGGQAPKLDVDLWAEILEADARLRRNDPHLSRPERADILATRFPRSARTIRGGLPD